MPQIIGPFTFYIYKYLDSWILVTAINNRYSTVALNEYYNTRTTTVTDMITDIDKRIDVRLKRNQIEGLLKNAIRIYKSAPLEVG